MNLKKLLGLALVVGTLPLMAHAAAVDYYLKIDGIDGESTSARHRGEIDVLSFSWGVSNPGVSAGGGAATGKLNVKELTIKKSVDKATPKLMEACAKGQHLDHVVLTLTRNNVRGTDTTYLTITLENVLISSYQTSASSGDSVPTDQLSLNFSKVTVNSPSGNSFELVVDESGQ